jgi:ABC-type branched-subunit amino acid transport system substrate-binding protein
MYAIFAVSATRVFVVATLFLFAMPTSAQIRVGQTTGFTGVSAAAVKETSSGAALWLDAVNARGGVNGQKVELISLDDKSDPKIAASNARILIEQRSVVALFLTRGTGTTEAIIPVLDQFGVPLVAPSTGAMSLHSPVKTHVFNVRTPYQLEAAKTIPQLASMGITRVGVLQTDDDFGRDTLLGAQRGFASSKLQPVFVETFERIKPDFKAIAARVARENLQAVLILGSGSAVEAAMSAIRAAGSKTYIVALSNTASAGLIANLGGNARGLIVTQVFPSERSMSVPMVKQANDLLQVKSKGSVLSPAMLEGFAGAKVLVEALRRAGRSPSRESVQRALEDLHFDLGGLSIDYSPGHHTGLESSSLSIIDANGRFER